MKKLIMGVLPSLVLLTGCEVDLVYDPELRAKRFDACLRNLPAGPNTTKYNDWAEVVRECESAAFYQSRVRRKG